MPAKPQPKNGKDGKERGGSRAVILEAASEEFARNGFAGARIDAIADRTRLNVRMIYYHFSSKEGLYQAVLEDIYRQMTTILDGAPAAAAGDVPGGSGPGGEAVAAFSRYVDLLAQQPRFAEILVREAIDGGKRLGQLFQTYPELFRLHQRACDLLQAAMDGEAFRHVDPALAVHSLTGMVCLLVAARSSQQLFLLGREVRPEEWKATLVDLFLHGLRAR